MKVFGHVFERVRRAAAQSPVRDFSKSASGNVAMLFALACFVIFPLVAFAVEVTRVVSHKTSLQYAVDAAALAAAQSVLMTPEERLEVVDAFMAAEQAKLGTEIQYQVFEDGEGELSIRANILMPLILGKLITKDDIKINVRSDAVMGGADLEVSIILDTTGSMAGSRIAALREAARDFVDIVVDDVQEPYYSKVAIVPYSVSVNVGPFAEAVRGAIVPGRNISGAAWINGPQRSISGATRANNTRITSNGHGLSNGNRILITGVNGMTQLNNNIYTVSNVETNRFRLQGVNSSSFGNYSSGGIIRRCLNTNCEVTVTASNHGFNTNDFVVINGVNGMTQINNGAHQTWQVTRQDNNAFILQGSYGPNYGNYTNNGRAFCTNYGCEFYRFLNFQSNAQRVHPISTCVSDRTGPQRLTDAPPSVEPVALMYPSTPNPCTNVMPIVPLTNDKAVLHNRIDSLFQGGSTSGQMGTMWGWYLLSPRWASLLPLESRPAAYGKPKLHKVAVLMTDGQFNTSYCNGVVSRDSTAGSGANADKINCLAPNGGGFAHAIQVCNNMKAQGIIIYSIGFEVIDDPAINNMLSSCASSPQHVFNASGSEALRQAFVQIARSIEEVRLTR